MKAAVVPQLRPAPDHRGGAGPRDRPARNPGAHRGQRRLPHRPARRPRRLAGQAEAAADPRPRGLRHRGGSRPRGDQREGGRPGRRALAAHGLRRLRALRRRLGDALRGPRRTPATASTAAMPSTPRPIRVTSVTLPDRVEMTEIAPVLCAGVTVYKGLKETDTKPGDWVVISGIGGARPHGRAVRQGDGPPRGRRRHRRRQAGAGPPTGRGHDHQRRHSGPGRGGGAQHWRCPRRAGDGGFRGPPSPRPWGWRGAAARWRSTACRRATFRCRSSMWC